MHNDGTGPQYDRPSRVQIERAANAEPTEWDQYQALLADGVEDAEARVAIWPDNALLYVEDEDGNEVLLPVGTDGFAIIPEEYVADGDGEDAGEAAGTESEDAEEDDADADSDDAAEDDEDAAEDEDEEDDAAEAETPEAPAYEPSEHTVDEVRAYLAENPDQTETVLDRERAGKSRVSLIGA